MQQVIPVNGIHIYIYNGVSSQAVASLYLSAFSTAYSLQPSHDSMGRLVRSNDRASLSDTCIPFSAYYLYLYPTNISTFVHAILMSLHHARPLEALSRTDTCHNIMLRNIDQLLISAILTSLEVHSPRIPPPAAAPAPPAGRPCLMYMG